VSGVYLYDDARARGFQPFALTRPTAELRAGALLLRERWAHVLGASVTGVVTSPHLASFAEPASAPIASAAMLPAGAWIVNARFAPSLSPMRDGAVLTADGRVAAIRLSADLSTDALAGGATSLDEIAGRASASAAIEGWWMDDVWDYVRHLVAMLAADIPLLADGIAVGAPRGATVVGTQPVYVEQGAVVEPSVCFDTTDGPIMLRAGSHVQAFTRLVGPLYVGEHSIITTDRISASSIGDTCKVHGELSNSIFLGHSNKGHDGFVGHSMIGRWVNLGAGTITSNLKNTYGPVQLWTPDGTRDTGMQFLGTMFGDHAKTGIGICLTTGCVLGAGANVFGRAMPPKAVAPFSWGEAGAFESYRIDKFLEAAERMMARRQVALEDGMRAQLQLAFEQRWTVET
jgi:UDP-N-acetylglucosamine diphosphorylase / glucose-1-phosphate thymidylyltransferase / UDP-N-acetylgalactosamine diphosphorylase / glucosamine-1-phosphate N-acetyltransferase / galactosamine-1-phosphate N-acetyltransferase